MKIDNFDIYKMFENIISEKEVTSAIDQQIDDMEEDLKDYKSSPKKPKQINSEKEDSEENNKLKPVLDDPEEEKEVPGKLSLDNAKYFSKFLEALNLLRSVKSFKDQDVKEELKDYFKELNHGERQSIFIFLKGLTQIANAIMTGEEASKPSVYGVKTKHVAPKNKEDKKDDKESKDVEKNVVKPKKALNKPEKSSLNPIKVESLQDKSSILSVLKENKD